MNQSILIANFKMNGSRHFFSEYCSEIAKHCCEIKKTAVVLAPPFPYLSECVEALKGSSVEIAAQCVSSEPSGAYTGEVSSRMLADQGVTHCLVGHSERIQHHQETSEAHVKMCLALNEAQIRPILCFADGREETSALERLQKAKRVLQPFLEKLPGDLIQTMVFAYEPLWAVGANKPAEPSEVWDLFSELKTFLCHKTGRAVSAFQMIYGGSINLKNSEAFLEAGVLNGFLVGRAALVARDFSELIGKMENRKTN